MMAHKPTSEEEVAEIVKAAAARKTTLEIVGGGTRQIGRPIQADAILSTSALTGITLFEPTELVVGAKAGTPVTEIQARLKENNLVLPFDPMDSRTLMQTDGEPTIGALAAANISGSKRVSAGAARDHLIGVRFVNGRGEIIKSGGRVMKDVTGLDLVKLQCGAYGTLGVLTEVVFKVLPASAQQVTLQFDGLTDTQALEVMTKALGSPFDISAAAHLPEGVSDTAQTLLNVQGFATSVNYRCAQLSEMFEHFGTPQRIEGESQTTLWQRIGNCAFFTDPSDREVWKINISSSKALALLEEMKALPDVQYYLDWAGGLVWVSAPTGVESTLRAVVDKQKAHALLMRASAERKAQIDVFQPLAAPLMTLTTNIKNSLDPQAILNPNRMYEGI